MLVQQAKLRSHRSLSSYYRNWHPQWRQYLALSFLTSLVEDETERQSSEYHALSLHRRLQLTFAMLTAIEPAEAQYTKDRRADIEARAFKCMSLVATFCWFDPRSNG